MDVASEAFLVAGASRRDETMAQSRPDVVVVGGGIGGLFAANALIAHGLRVSVYEQAPASAKSAPGCF